MGYGFDLKVAKITGILTFFGSFIFNTFYLIGKNFFNMHTSTKKWLFIKYSSILLTLMIWFIINLTSIYDNDYTVVVEFFITQPSKIIFSIFIVVAYFFQL